MTDKSIEVPIIGGTATIAHSTIRGYVKDGEYGVNVTVKLEGDKVPKVISLITTYEKFDAWYKQ